MKNVMKKGCGCLLGASVLICLIVAIIFYVSKPKWSDGFGQKFTDIAYGNNPHNTYDLFLPHDACSNDSLALILYVHGGSWLGGDKEWHHGDCYNWVKKGYATATLNYSFLNEKNVSFVTMVDEIESCVRHILDFAAKKGAHIRQMAIAGTSAGGHLAMLYAYNHSHPIPLLFEAIKVGPSDFRVLFPHENKMKTEDLKNLVFCCTGKQMVVGDYSKKQIDSVKLQASPVNYINKSTAIPAIFAYGEKDDLIKPEHYRALSVKYDSIGGTYNLIVFPNSGHNLLGDKDCSERYDSTLTVYCKRYFGY